MKRILTFLLSISLFLALTACSSPSESLSVTSSAPVAATSEAATPTASPTPSPTAKNLMYLISQDHELVDVLMEAQRGYGPGKTPDREPEVDEG